MALKTILAKHSCMPVGMNPLQWNWYMSFSAAIGETRHTRSSFDLLAHEFRLLGFYQKLLLAMALKRELRTRSIMYESVTNNLPETRLSSPSPLSSSPLSSPSEFPYKYFGKIGLQVANRTKIPPRVNNRPLTSDQYQRQVPTHVYMSFCAVSQLKSRKATHSPFHLEWTDHCTRYF